MTDRFLSAGLDGDGRVFRDDAPGALLPWWSFTKTLIAACVLIRAREGFMDLDAEMPGRPYSLRQLMTHTSGLRDYGPVGTYQQAVSAGEDPWPVAKLLQEARADDPLGPPGRKWCYSNIGYMFLRFALEVSEGAPLGEVIHRRLIAPLGLKSPRMAMTPADFAALTWDADGYHPGWVYHGCMIGSPADAARLLYGILHGDLLSAAEKEQMMQLSLNEGAIDGRIWRTAGYGLGLMIGQTEHHGLGIGHAGCGPMSGNLVAYFPQSGVTVASFSRGGDEAPAEWEALRVISSR
ncbi:Penicillin-binding protein E [Thalassovita autumnalis]|uniref:Penicillin-binding protein E n=1 Tax=Thalassovita autumnalis TaxID=2072972 RepID=A0A0P1FNV8_9RHOB|nr:serine hydrolase domain-containing protein [Thalassovita autumnalis]CUH69812.1 Penicillin-binding protein E [Thalassovita autumnalis]CUH70980.1 Penicillin-binding protein E [Thalassovita autumnalis]